MADKRKKREQSDAGPMVVIATQRGDYGKKTRYTGERFGITHTRHFSKRWMIDPKDPKNADEVRRLEAQYKSEHVNVASRDITDEQLLAELAESGGAVAALRQENKMLKARVAELEAQLEAGNTGAGGSGEATEATGGAEAGAVSGEGAEDGEGADAPAEAEDGGAEGGEPSDTEGDAKSSGAAKARPTRRRTR